MDEVIRNVGPMVGVMLVALLGWLDVRRMHRKRNRAAEDAAE